MIQEEAPRPHTLEWETRRSTKSKTTDDRLPHPGMRRRRVPQWRASEFFCRGRRKMFALVAAVLRFSHDSLKLEQAG
jgi:hypothetical protein